MSGGDPVAHLPPIGPLVVGFTGGDLLPFQAAPLSVVYVSTAGAVWRHADALMYHSQSYRADGLAWIAIPRS